MSLCNCSQSQCGGFNRKCNSEPICCYDNNALNFELLRSYLENREGWNNSLVNPRINCSQSYPNFMKSISNAVGDSYAAQTGNALSFPENFDVAGV
ncbi:MAG: hypothetical protein RSC41_06830, partial [Oscillospiraceae bacterium]